MKKKIIPSIILGMFFLFLMPIVSAIAWDGTCQAFGTANGYYTLNSNVSISVSALCNTITANNITIDFMGYTYTVNHTSAGTNNLFLSESEGVVVDNLTITNGTIKLDTSGIGNLKVLDFNDNTNVIIEGITFKNSIGSGNFVISRNVLGTQSTLSLSNIIVKGTVTPIMFDFTKSNVNISNLMVLDSPSCSYVVGGTEGTYNVHDSNLGDASCTNSIGSPGINTIFNLYNVTYTKSFSVEDGYEFNRYWRYKAYVNDTNGNPVIAEIIYNNSNGINVFNLTSGSDGYTIIENVLDFIYNVTGTFYYSNYSLTSSNSSYFDLSSSFNITLEQNFDDVLTMTESVIPSVSINSPLNKTYNTNSITFNITATDNSAVDSCWYSLNSGTDNISLSNSGNYWTNTNASMTQGSHTANFYCNDTSNNLNNTEEVTFFIDSVLPVISIVSPSDGYTIQDFVSGSVPVDTNFSLTETNLDSCWYTINSGATNTSVSCSAGYNNFTFYLTSAGTFTLEIFANDSANNENSSSIQVIMNQYSGPQQGSTASPDLSDRPSGFEVYNKSLMCKSIGEFLIKNPTITQEKKQDLLNILSLDLGFAVTDEVLDHYLENYQEICVGDQPTINIPEKDKSNDTAWVIFIIFIVVMIILVVIILSS